MDNVRIMFDDVNVTSESEHFPLLVARMVESRAKISGTIGVTPKPAPSSLGLNIDIAPDRLRLEIIDFYDDKPAIEGRELNLAKITEWPAYKSKSITSISGQSKAEVESFLQGAFSIAQKTPLQKPALALAEKMGVFFKDELDLVFGDGPDSPESKGICANLAHLALAVSPQMRFALIPHDHDVVQRQLQYEREAYLDPRGPNQG